MSPFRGNKGLFQLKVFEIVIAEGSGCVFVQVVSRYKYQETTAVSKQWVRKVSTCFVMGMTETTYPNCAPEELRC